ncbi:MAG TPA: type IV secretion system protein [Longimicrobiaceae bacterium]|jgi:P-type conjugative transfer protein TrbL|nr:type IV secretion system protein [Longimicrobiaceae bacterium]
MIRTVSRYLASFALAAIPMLRPTAALAQAAGSERVVVGIVDQFRQATASWPSLFLPYAQMLLLGLLALEAYLSWADWQTRQIGLERVVAEAVRKLGVIALVWAFFTNPLLGPEQVITVFRDVAGHAAGVSDAGALPGDLVLQGFSLADVLLRAAGQAMGELVTAWWEISRNLIEQGAVDGGFLGVGVLVAHLHALRILAATVLLDVVFSTVVVGIGVVVLEVGFAFVALQVVLVELETILLIGFGPFFAGFASFRVTAGMTEAFLKQAVVLGLRLFLTLPLAALGMRLADFWSRNLLASVTRRTLQPQFVLDGRTVRLSVEVVYLDPMVVVLVLVSVCFYVYLVWSYPSKYARALADLRLNLPAAVAGKAG